MDQLIDKSILSNFDIVQICQILGIKLDGVIMNNQFTDKMLNYDFSIIINFQNTNQNGSHWTAIHCEPSIKTVYSIDSYGELPTARIYKIIIDRGYQLYFNKVQFQALEQQVYGWYAKQFLYYLQQSKKRDKLDKMVKYLNLFTKEVRNLDNNDKTIKMLFHQTNEEKEGIIYICRDFKRNHYQ